MCHRVSNNIKGKCVQGRISKTYIINSKSNCIVYYTYCLQERGYAQFIGYSTGQMYWRRADGYIYYKLNKYYIRCGYSRSAELGNVGPTCILYQRGRNWSTSFCGGKSKLRSTSTRSGTMKKCCRMCTRPGLSTCRTIRNICQTKKKYILNTVATNGADRTNKGLLACFGPEADDECEEIIAMLEDGNSEEYGNYWDPPNLGNYSGERKTIRSQVN